MVAAAGRRIAHGGPPVLAALASGALFAASFPPLSWTALGFVAWVPLMLAVHAPGRSNASARVLAGLGCGTLFGPLALSIDPPEVITGAAWLGVSAAVAVAFGLVAGLLAVPVMTPRLHAALRGWGIVWLPALVWAGVEYLRLVTTAGHQWGMTATAQIDVAPLRAFLPLAGMWPVAIIAMATNGAIAALILVARGRWTGSRRALGWTVGTVAGAWVLGGVLALLPPPESTGTLRAALVQPGEHVPDHPLTRPLIVRRQYAELTEVITALHGPPTVAAQGAQLVVWPEASGWVDPLTPTGQALAQQVADVAARSGTTIVWPYFIRIDWDHTRNEAVLVYPDGRLSAPSTKAHPVWVIGERSITEGLHPVYAVDGVAVGLALGPDGSYTDALARLARDGAQVVAVPTHDWAAYAGTQLAHLRVRAAEHRLAIVKADWRYGSAIVAPDGSIVAATPLTTQVETMLAADVAVTTPGTPYSASGDWLGVVSLVVAVGAVAASMVSGRVGRRRSSSRSPC